MNARLGSADVTRRQECGGIWGGSAPSRHTGLACGLAAGTSVATAMGWRPVEAIAEGDLVLTFDRGLQPVRRVVRGVNWDGTMPCPPGLRPLIVPAGALGNLHEMTLLPEQSVMVESDTADALFGDPFALVVAAGLVGFRGIERSCGQIVLDVVQLQFDTDEIVFAGHGALAFCPSNRVVGIDTILSTEADAPPAYRSLPRDETALLLDCMADEDAAAAQDRATAAPVYAAAFA